MIKYLLPLTSFFLSALLVSVTQAAMRLDKMIVYFNPDQTYQDVVVQNPDKEPLYLRTSVVKVEKPGTSKEKRVNVVDPDKMQLLVSPQKVIIPPGGRKTIRLVSLHVPKKKEAVYRVNFTPVVGDVKATRSAVKILIAYQTLVFVRPKNAFFQVVSQPKGNSITFTNNGDVNVLLRNGKYCPENANKDKCITLKQSTRLYAGESWTMKLPESANKSGMIEFGLYDGKKEYGETFSLTKKTVSSLEDVS